MCGITGLFGSFSLSPIRAMTDRVAHRGPDGEGFWLDQEAGIALGHRRLAIIDLSDEARQPMTNEDGTLQLTFNGEIYNFRELRERLVAKGHRFRSRGDSETILHLYEEHGVDVVDHLDGIFAFGLWDGKRRQLLLARDRFGVKPLYYVETPDGIAFASELKSLIAVPGVPRDIDFETVDQHLSYIWSAAPKTMFRAIKKLEPGYRIVARDGRIVRHEPFGDLGFDGSRLDGTEAERIEQVRERVADAVERQMVSDVPVGAFLSGGIDSTAVVAMMARAGRAPVTCYTIGIGDGATDANESDLPYARLVAKRFGIELREVEVWPDVLGFAERMVYQLDEPIADPACINVYLIAFSARADGNRVLLSGVGGDDVFSGYRRHQALLFDRYWSWLPRPTRRLLAGAAARLGASSPTERRLQKILVTSPLSPEERLMSYFLWSTEEMRRAVYSPELRGQLEGYDSFAPLRASLSRIPGETDPLNRMLYLELRHFLADHNLIYTDKMSMAHGIEVRVPFLDAELVRYATHLPTRDKQRRGNVKYALKAAMRGIVPDAILRRSKTGFGAPLRRWIRGDLREMVNDVLSEEALSRRGLFDPAAVKALIGRNERGEVDASYMIFSLMCIEMWMRNFVDDVPVAAPAVPESSPADVTI